MFDIGFWELMILGLVALLVVGPERLPKLAYTAGKWLGKGRSMLSAVKSEIDKEIKAEELKQVLEQQKSALNPLHEVIEETGGTLREFGSQADRTLREAERKLESPDEASPGLHDSNPDTNGQAIEQTSKQDDSTERTG